MLSSNVDDELLKQANQAAVDFSKKALSSLFLLNGAAATALLTQSFIPLRVPAIIFAFAALWTVAAMGIAHVHCLFICETFRSTEINIPLTKWPKRLILLWGFPNKLQIADFIPWRLRLILFSCVPAVLFLLGLLVTGIILGSS